eukprot:maker-scaffold_14-snap-gene-5.60-mRNA-1 protein AED:0.00 eAED:0.00 QI:68/1/1/1/0/0/2/884/387
MEAKVITQFRLNNTTKWVIIDRSSLKNPEVMLDLAEQSFKLPVQAPQLRIKQIVHSNKTSTSIFSSQRSFMKWVSQNYFNAVSLHIRFGFNVSLKGGKGGFGKILKGEGRKNKATTTDFGACRDLQGRRLRTLNNERRLEVLRSSLETSGNQSSSINEAVTTQNKWHLPRPVWAAEHVSPRQVNHVNKRKRKMCNAWLRAREGVGIGCSRGEGCKYAHGEEELLDDKGRKVYSKKVRVEKSKEDVKFQKELELRKQNLSSYILQGMNSKEEKEEQKILVSKEEEVKEVENEQNLVNVEKVVMGKVSNLAKATEENTDEKVVRVVDLDNVPSLEDLKTLSVEEVTWNLKSRCLKAGGRPEERYIRLFSVKGIKPEDYPKKIRAKKKKS